MMVRRIVKSPDKLSMEIFTFKMVKYPSIKLIEYSKYERKAINKKYLQVKLMIEKMPMLSTIKISNKLFESVKEYYSSFLNISNGTTERIKDWECLNRQQQRIL